MKSLILLTLSAVAVVCVPSARAALIDDGNFADTTLGTAAGSPPNIVDSTDYPDFRFFNVYDTTTDNVGFGSQIVAVTDPLTSTSALGLRLDVNNIAAEPAGGYGFDDNNDQISTTPLTSYLITFYAANIAGGNLLDVTTQPYGSGTPIGAAANNVFTITNLATGAGTTASPFANLDEYSLVYTAPVGANDLTLGFVPSAGVANADAFVIDDIGFAPVPEPRTWAMMLGGLVLLGVVTGRRHRTV